MDITVLLNADEANDADWEFQESDSEEAGADEVEVADGGDVSDSETSAVALPSAARRTGNTYVDGLIHDSGLHVIRDREVKAAYKERGELGLFSLFFTREFRDSLQS